jgi:hypothetical protein
MRATEGSALNHCQEMGLNPSSRAQSRRFIAGSCLAPAGEGAGPESLKRLEHEYSFKQNSTPAWAARPIAIAFHWNRPVLVLEDPGSIPLDRLVGQASDLGSSLRRAISLATAIRHLHFRGIVHKTSSLPMFWSNPLRTRLG